MPLGRRGHWENCWKGLDTILVDRRIKVREVAEALSVSYAMVMIMLNKNKSITKKMSTQRVPRLLTADKERRDGCQWPSSVWTPSIIIRSFFRRVITIDET